MEKGGNQLKVFYERILAEHRILELCIYNKDKRIYNIFFKEVYLTNEKKYLSLKDLSKKLTTKELGDLNS